MAPSYSSSMTPGGSGGSISGVGSFQTLPYIPAAHFPMTTVNGDSRDYVPSTFVPYAKAVAEGRAVLATRPISLGEFARRNEANDTAKAKLELVQDYDGNAVVRKL